MVRIEIIKGDITTVSADALVNAANASSATLAYIHKKSMPKAKANHIREIAESCGLKVVESADLEDI